MAELITLTTPVPALATYTVVELHLNWPAESLSIGLRGSNGEMTFHSYSGAEATALMRALNKANLSTSSLQKRAIQQLVADGKLAGTISGSPD
jgi:hypothetical protein